MLKLVSNSVLASEIAELLNKPLIGNDIVIYGPANIENLQNNSLIYIEDYRDYERINFSKYDEVLILTNALLKESDKYSFIQIDKPSIALIKIVEKYFTISIENQIHSKAIIEEGAKIGKNVLISSGCYVGSDVRIGDNSIVWDNTIIKGKTTIGNNCVIKSNSTIGSDIFNFILDEEQWIQFPQIGEILIEDDVWIGASTTIEKGTIGNTIIKKGVRIDDLVQIGSNCNIGEKTVIAAGSILSRDVKIGKQSWIAPNVSIRDRIIIADNVMVGIGSVVINNISEGSTVVGNPAKLINKK
jgi:UDP-3-O-[3-hydroxymyristoyl] glucosamine N-acyltransferase